MVIASGSIPPAPVTYLGAMLAPPSMGTLAPVIQDASDEHRNNSNEATFGTRLSDALPTQRSSFVSPRITPELSRTASGPAVCYTIAH